MSLFTADQLVAHAVGDYLLQSDWMANEKTKRSVAALAHVVCYALPFLFLTQSPLALLVIAGTHFVIDRWRLAKWVVLLKNMVLAPHSADTERSDWWDLNTGSPKARPPFLSVWLLIIVDNLLHVTINALALQWLS